MPLATLACDDLGSFCQNQLYENSPGSNISASGGRIRRSSAMRFVFPVVGSVIIALLFVNFYPPLRSPLRFSTIKSDWLKVSYPNRLQALTPTPGPTPEMASPPVLAPTVQTQSAVEAEASIE